MVNNKPISEITADHSVPRSPEKGASGGIAASMCRDESGIALVMVIVLSAIALAIMAGLIYMITVGTQVTGLEKRYKTAREAGFGGGELVYQILGLRGDAAITNSFISDLNTKLAGSFALDSSLQSGCVSNCCAAAGITTGASYTGLTAKLNAATVDDAGNTNWGVNCNTSESVGPSSYDMKFDLGTDPTYHVYARIVDTVEGNSSFTSTGGGAGGIRGNQRVGGVTGGYNPGGNAGSSAGGEITVMSVPYVYTIEVDAERTSNPPERAKLSILYQY
jgi:hypothetical protein